jgi:hypothetical protein
LALFPRIARAPVLGGSVRGRACRHLGSIGMAPLWPTGFSSSWKSVRVIKSRFNVSMTDLPLLGFHLLMVSTLADSGSRRAPSCFTAQVSVARRPNGCTPRYSVHGSRPSLTRGSSHPKVPCLRPLSCSLVPDAGIFGLRLFTSVRRHPCEHVRTS